MAAVLAAGSFVAPATVSGAGAPLPIPAPEAVVTKTIATICTWTPLGETIPRTVAVPVEVTATVPASTARDAIVEVGDISSTIVFSASTGSAMYGTGVRRLQLLSQQLQIGTVPIDLSGGTRPSISLSFPVAVPAAAPMPGVAGVADAMAVGNSIPITYGGFEVVAYSREPFGSVIYDCQPSGDAKIADITVRPGPSAPVVKQVVGKGIAGIGGLVELRGTSLRTIKKLQFDGRAVPFWYLGGRLLVLLPSRPAGAYPLEGVSAGGVSIGVPVSYVRLF